MGFFRKTIEDIFAQIDRLVSSDKVDEEKKAKKLAALELEAKMTMASMRQSSMIAEQMKARIPSVTKRKSHTIVDSKKTLKLNKYSFTQQQQYEILDRRAKRINTVSNTEQA